MEDAKRRNPKYYAYLAKGNPVEAIDLMKHDYMIPQEASRRVVEVVLKPLSVGMNVLYNNPSIYEHIQDYYPKTSEEVVRTQFEVAPRQKSSSEEVEYVVPHFEPVNRISLYIPEEELKKKVYQPLRSTRIPETPDTRTGFVTRGFGEEPFNYD